MADVRGERELSSVASVARTRRFQAEVAGMADVRDERELSPVARVASVCRFQAQVAGMAGMRGERELSSVRRFPQSTPRAVHVHVMGIVFLRPTGRKAATTASS
eukprot:11179346-Lingulodinium_polyedra.AAC.1